MRTLTVESDMEVCKESQPGVVLGARPGMHGTGVAPMCQGLASLLPTGSLAPSPPTSELGIRGSEFPHTEAPAVTNRRGTLIAGYRCIWKRMMPKRHGVW